MSKNATLGMIVRAAVGVPEEHGEVAAKLMNYLSWDYVLCKKWHQQLLDVLEGRSQIVSMPLPRDEDLCLVVPPEAYTTDWDAFLKRTDVLCLDSFKDLIPEDQGAQLTERSTTVGRTALQRNANDTNIRKDLPADHPLQLREFVWSIINGGAKQGGAWYLGYVLIGGRVYVVGARCGSGSGQWLFAAWRLDDNEWDAGNHVLFADSRTRTV